MTRQYLDSVGSSFQNLFAWMFLIVVCSGADVLIAFLYALAIEAFLQKLSETFN